MRLVAGSHRQVSVPYTRIVINAPFVGEKEFFNFHPSNFTMNPPQAIVGDSELKFEYERRELDAPSLRRQLGHAAGLVEWLWCY